MDRPVIVLGAGGHAKVLLDMLLSQGADVLGILDHDVQKIGQTLLGVPVIGTDSDISKYSKQSIYLVNGIGSIGSTRIRQELFTKFKKQGYCFATMIHSSAIIAEDVQLKEGAQVMAGAVIQAGTSIGENSIVNTRVAIDHDCLINDHVHISPGATLCGGVTVGASTHIGAGTTIIQGIKIGPDCTIGAGSLVIRDIPAKRVAFGTPAKEVMV